MKFILFITILILNSIFINNPSLAVLREHHQSSEVISYHSQWSIKDKYRRAWQIILFPDDINKTNPKYYLRLVGFPGLVEFVHPYPLEITTNKGKSFIASDIFAESNPASNVGQYDLTEIIDRLPNKGRIKLIFSSKGDRGSEDISLNLKTPILTEWHWLYKSIIDN